MSENISLKEKVAKKYSVSVMSNFKDTCVSADIKNAFENLISDAIKAGWDYAIEFACAIHRRNCPIWDKCPERIGKDFCNKDCSYMQMYYYQIKDKQK